MWGRSVARLGRVVLVAALTTAAWAVPAEAYRDVERPVTLRHNVAVSPAAVEPGFPIDYVGVLWREDDRYAEHGPEQVEEHGAVRFRHAGVWSEWTPLQPDGADAPGQWSSGLVGGRDAEAFQVRGLPDHAGGARAVALNTTDGPTEVVDRVPAGPQALTRCQTRAEWGADETLMTWAPQHYPAQVMTVHHTVTSNGDTDPEATVRAIYEYHAVDNGWGDIGYHYLVDGSGVTYEGRWSGEASTACEKGGDASDFAHAPDGEVVTAAHTGGSNSGNVGVALLGDFTSHRKFANTPTSAATGALTDVLAELSHRHRIVADVTVTYTNPVTLQKRSIATVSGHRDWASTECPGDNLYALLPDLRQEVVDKVAGMSTGPTLAISSPADGATVAGTLTVAATASDDVTAVDFALGGRTVTDGVSTDGWSGEFDTTGLDEGTHEVSASATVGDVVVTDSISVTVDNTAEPVTVSVVDLDAHTHARGQIWDAHAVVQVADSDGNALPDAEVHGLFTGSGIPETPVSCQIDATRCELHLDGLDKRLVKSVTFSVTDVQDGAGPYDAAGNRDPDGDSDGTTISIAP